VRWTALWLHLEILRVFPVFIYADPVKVLGEVIRILRVEAKFSEGMATIARQISPELERETRGFLSFSGCFPC